MPSNLGYPTDYGWDQALTGSWFNRETGETLPVGVKPPPAGSAGARPSPDISLDLNITPESPSPAPGLAIGGAVNALSPVSSPLAVIAKYESGGRNIKNPVSSASGPWQMLNSTWRETAGKLGVDTNLYPTAMSAPVDVQQRVAQRLYDDQGYAPWAPYNSNLAKAIGYKTGLHSQVGGGGNDLGGVVAEAPPAQPAGNSLTPPPPAPPPAGLASSPLAMMALMAAGTHAFVPVSYDPFKLMPKEMIGSPRVIDAPSLMGSPGQVAVPGVSGLSAVSPVSYITRTGMKSQYQLPALAP